MKYDLENSETSDMSISMEDDGDLLMKTLDLYSFHVYPHGPHRIIHKDTDVGDEDDGDFIFPFEVKYLSPSQGQYSIYKRISYGSQENIVWLGIGNSSGKGPSF